MTIILITIPSSDVQAGFEGVAYWTESVRFAVEPSAEMCIEIIWFFVDLVARR